MQKAIQENPKVKHTLERINGAARVGIWELDFKTKSYIIDNITCEIIGVPHGHKLGYDDSYGFMKHKSEAKKLASLMEKLVSKGTGFDIEIEIFHKTKDLILVRKIGLADIEDGVVKRVYGIFQDITRIKQAERELQATNSELNSIINSSAVAIVSINRDNNIKHFNSGAEKLLGYTAKEAIASLDPQSLLLPEQVYDFKLDLAKLYNKNPDEIQPFKELAKQNKSDTREWTFRKKNGDLVPVELSLTPLKNEEDKHLGILGIFYDITDRKKAETELIQKNQILNYAEQITMMGNWRWNMITAEINWSDNMYSIFGRDREKDDVVFDTYFNYIHPEDREKVANFITKTVSDKKFTDVLHRIVLDNGTVRTVHLLGELVLNDFGEPTHMIGTCQDVTQLRMAEIKFRGLLESAPDAMIIVDENGIIQISNKQTQKLFGYTSLELDKKPVELLIPEKFMHTYETSNNNFFTTAKYNGLEKSEEFYGVNNKGVKIPIQINLSPLETEEGLLISVAIRDITEQKQAEYKILKSKERLEVLTDNLLNKNRQLADFAHITSHNLRAPVSNLNSLLGFYNTSEDEEDKAVLFEKFEIVVGHLTETLDTLVEALKTSNGAPTELKKLKFEDALLKTAEILTGEIHETGAIIKSDFTNVPTILYSKVYLESIFLNLVSNALKYRSPDRTPEITLKSFLVRNRVTLTIEDNGLGIDLERHGHKLFGLNKVFHRHPQAKGIGLFMTKVQIESLGGTITAESTVNKGTTFILTLN